MLGPDHPYRGTLILKRPCCGDSIFSERVMGGKKLNRHAVNEYVLGVDGELPRTSPGVNLFQRF